MSFVIACLLSGGAPRAVAAELAVAFSDASGKAIDGGVVTVRSLDTTTQAHGTRGARAAAPVKATVDQIGLRFTPSVLVVPVGASVSFPNSDVVSHQVYSFSSAKKFQLPLYRGSAHPPVVFDKPGIVTLGCNIHDDMVAHIVVTDAPWYGQTAPDGSFRLAQLEPGRYEVSVWHPRLRTGMNALTQQVTLEPGATLRAVAFRSDGGVRADRAPPKRPGWDGY